MSAQPDIRAGARRAVASAVELTTGNVHRNATGASVDTIIDHACMVRVLDEIASCAAELLGALQGIGLTGDAQSARHVLIGLLEQAGYVAVIGGGKDEQNQR